MWSAVSSVISGAGAELVVGGHGTCTMMTIVPMLLVYRCTGGLYRCPAHCQWSRTQSRGHLGRGNTGTCPHQWSPVGMAPSSVSLDTVCSILQGRLCEPTRGPVSVLRSARQRKVKSEYKLKHMLWNPALEILSGLHRRPFLEFSKQLKQNKTQNFWNFLCPEFNCPCNLSSFHSEFLQTLDLEL